jgi:TonB family protein
MRIPRLLKKPCAIPKPARPNAMKLLFYWLLLGGLLLGTTTSAFAQLDTTAVPGILICPVEKMPELWIGGKAVGIVATIQQNLVYPLAAKRAHAEGRVFVSFTVTAAGAVKNAHVVRGFRPDCDAAALRAVRQLPRFEPVQQAGRPIASGLTVPVKFILNAPYDSQSSSSLSH